MSAGHLSREFRLAYGESPYGYLMTRRIERAMALLRRGDLSATEGCFAVGCSSLGTLRTRLPPLGGRPPRPQRHRRRVGRRLLVAGPLQPPLHRARRGAAEHLPPPRRTVRRGHPRVRRQAGHPTGQESRSTGRRAVPSVTAMTTTTDLTVHHTFLPHDDAEAALAFYRDTLGFELRNDVGYGGMRWPHAGPAGRRRRPREVPRGGPPPPRRPGGRAGPPDPAAPAGGRPRRHRRGAPRHHRDDGQGHL